MFNQEIKEKYLATREGVSAGRARGLFEASQDLEISLGKDLAEFSVSELGEFMGQGGFSEPDSIRTKQAAIAKYSDWYCSYHPTTKHNIRDFDLKDFPYAKYFAATVTKTPEDLVNRITQVYDVDSAQPAIPTLCFAWLGLESADAAALRKEQVDTFHGKIYDMTGNVVVAQMPDIIREVLDVYGKTYTAIRTQNQTFMVYADDIGFFIKRMKSQNSEKVSKPLSNKQLVAYIRNMQDLYQDAFGKEAGIWLNYTNVQRSGNFYRLHQMAKSGVDVYSTKNADKVRLCLGPSKRNHKDNMLMYNAYLEVIGEK